MELKQRTRRFGVRIIRLSAALPLSREADVVARQLVRAGTSPGAHFREAIRSRSKAEYVAKLNGGLMELEETLYWLEMIEDMDYKTKKQLSSLTTETDQLIAIFVSLIKKWRRR